MQPHHYPFIDLAVHAAVRDRFVQGDAVAVLSGDLGEMLWANSAAADLFGFTTIYDALDEGFGGQTATMRQIGSALSVLERTGKPQNFMMRVTRGFSRLIAPATLERVLLPDQTQALLLTSKQAGPPLAPDARARKIIAGFEGTGTHVAVLDQDGKVLAASGTFSEIGLAESDIVRMVRDVATDESRLVKRMTQAHSGLMPTAIGRLADDPALHLLFAVDPAQPDARPANVDDAPEPAHGGDSHPVSASGLPHQAFTPDLQPGDPSAPDQDHDAGASIQPDDTPVPAADQEPSLAPVAASTPAASAARTGYFDLRRIRDELNARLAKHRHSDDVPGPFAEARGIDVEAAVSAANGDAAADQAGNEGEKTIPDPATEPQTTPESAESAETGVREVSEHPADQDRSEPTDAPDSPGEPVVETVNAPAGDGGEPAADFRYDPHAKPARFVWKINRDGEFSEVSPEFADAVGPQSADIIGRKFPDLARVFNLDPDHVISDLLNRRDTWSGKTVFWPIQGTDLVTPVDLAALPTYTRDRQFDGFRGFGIVRSGDTRKDPEALGLALMPGTASGPLTGTIDAEDSGETGTEAPGQASAPDHDALAAGDEADLEMLSLEQDIEDLARMDRTDDSPVSGDGLEDDTGPDATGPDATDTDTGGESTEKPVGRDPFRGERPAIRLVETPMRRDSDKIIDLETRRSKPRESLSPGEQAAFREIGLRLNETSKAAADAPESEPVAAASPQDREPFGKRPEPRTDDQPGADGLEGQSGGSPTADDADPSGSHPDSTADESAGTEAPADAPSPDPGPDLAPAAVEAPGRDLACETPLPSAFALPARQVMPTGLDVNLVDAIPAALLVHAGDVLIHANAEFFELTGYSSLADLDACGGLDHLLERSFDDDHPDGGMAIRRKDGSTLGVTARLRSINWGDGHALMLALSPDATMAEPLAAETAPAADVEPALAASDETASAPEAQSSALKIEAQELRSILETATDGVVILNKDGTIRSMNGSACALFNYDESETHGEPFAMLFAQESQRAVMDYVNGLADHGVSSVLNDGREVIGREISGGFLPLFMTIGRLSGSNGYCAVLRDITQWKRTEDELRTAKRAAETANSHKSDFLARVSHEIRTPLNAIIGFSEMMMEERFGPIGSPRYLEYAHDIGNSGKHVLDIVNDLLDISKIEAGQVQMEFIAVSLNDHLAESVSLLQPMANSQRVIIRTSLSASVPEVVADQRSIKQIALNLLSNAIRYTPSGGQIVVSTSYEPSGNVVIRIRDTGIGMNRKELEQAMKPFGQVGPGPRQRGDGTGLGLPLTKAMVDANRAQFDIVSAPGEGTLVTIAFPPQRVLAD
ncbi:ATP-binding protein [Hoeflea sp. YIM 152468]|uniref:ATP-binding protein n=1 Tax=Hoeflea sp. YIM 152468 TaxID=3031759 RepID=UPI0023DA97DD|nr:ATP-binding protein [Hoeflea sp. YIM 152468]MDF1606592.1 ATP-binding protein [Hoeflea sp. YIM 152468]